MSFIAAMKKNVQYLLNSSQQAVTKTTNLATKLWLQYKAEMQRSIFIQAFGHKHKNKMPDVNRVFLAEIKTKASLDFWNLHISYLDFM